MKFILFSILAICLLVCLLLFWMQERLIFHPVRLAADYTFAQFPNAEEHYFQTSTGTIHALYFHSKAARGVVLYFHGNSGANDEWGYAAADLTRLGYDVMMPDYRTYGKSTGPLSEATMYSDARLTYNYLRDNWEATQIVLYGRSLGTGVATELATQVEAKLLILETPYSSMIEMARKTLPMVPAKWLLSYSLDNLSKIDKIKCPVHIFAATMDKLTPFEHAEILAKRAGNQEAILTPIVGAGHGDISDFEIYHQQLASLLRD